MKKNLLIAVFVFIGNILIGQNFDIKLYAIDSIGRIDSVIFGHNTIATDTIDVSLGEENIYGVPYDSLDLRAIQRNDSNLICSDGGYYFPSPINLDTKINFRKFDLHSHCVFEFSLNGIAYPIQIYCDYREMYDSSNYNGWTWALVDDTICNTPFVCNATDSYMYLFTVQDKTQNIIKMNLDYVEDGIDEILNENLKIYPNPFTNYLFIGGFKNQKYLIEISSVTGIKELQIKTSYIDIIKIPTDNITNGIHFIKVTNIDTGNFKVYKQIKI